MRKSIIVLFTAAFAVFGLAATSIASTNAGVFKDGPYTATTPDSGCQSNNWAQDLFVRNFVVKLPPVSGIYTVTEKFQKGHFSTYPGFSPGNGCGGNANVNSGITGTFNGTFTMSVTPGMSGFNPGGSCDMTTYPGWSQCDTAGWVTGFFGAGATYSVGAYHFKYKAAGGQGLIASQWVNADTGNIGDIANS